MEALLYFALWAGLMFLMMRFGHGAHFMGHGHGNGQAQTEPGKVGNPEVRWVPPKKDTDPVCGKTVSFFGEISRAEYLERKRDLG